MELRLRWQRLVPWFSGFLFISSFVVPVGLLIWLLLGTNIFVVQLITIVDAREHTEAEIRTLLQNKLVQPQTTSWRNNIFFIQTEPWEEEIVRNIPRVRSAHITRLLPNTLKVVVQEKRPNLLLLSQRKYYLVDDQGIAYEEVQLNTLPGIVLPTVKNKRAEETIVLGTPVLSEAFIAFVHRMYEELPKRLSTQVAEIHTPSLIAREVTFVLTNNWEVRFDTTRDPMEQVEVLQRLADTLLTPEEKIMLEYIDLRIPDRIYYKTR